MSAAPAAGLRSGANALSEGVSVRAFGAKGDGVTDDTVAIQLAIDHGVAENVEVIFPPGTYIVNPTKAATFPVGSVYALKIKSNMHLRGMGQPTIKIMDGVSTEAAPLAFAMFYSAISQGNISFFGLKFDGNWQNNKISPRRRSRSFNNFNQVFIGFMGDAAAGTDVSISDCSFANNAGVNNIICGVPRTHSSSGQLGSRWTITRTLHANCGMDSSDFTAIFGYAEDVTCVDSIFYQDASPTDNHGAGARNAFEVHGTRARFVGNRVRSYFGGVIVSSNWVRPVEDVEITGNDFTDMFLYGIRFWRQGSKGAVQTKISGVVISKNFIELNSTLFATAFTYKAGIFSEPSTFAYAINDVVISNNTVVQHGGAKNVSAGVLLTPGGANGEKFEGFEITDNRFTGVYNGILVRTIAGGAGATFGRLMVEGNKTTNLKNVGVNVNPIAWLFRGATGRPIDHLIFENNITEDDSSGAGQTKYGLWLQGAITKLDRKNNRFVNVATPLKETGLTVSIRRDDNLK